MGLCIEITPHLSIEERRESIVISDDSVYGEFYKEDILALISFFQKHPEYLEKR